MKKIWLVYMGNQPIAAFIDANMAANDCARRILDGPRGVSYRIDPLDFFETSLKANHLGQTG
jgi:hypothetical protein